MYRSKNCGHGFDLYIKTQQLLRRASMPLTREEELMDELQDITGVVYLMYQPLYCPICGKKVEGAEND